MSDFSHPQQDPSGRSQTVEFAEALPAVFGFLIRRCGDRDLAEELASATFVSAVANQPGDSWAIPWLLTIARNKLIDHWRRQGRVDAVAGRVRDLRHLAPPDPSVEEQLEVAAVFGQLTPDHQMILTLRHFDDMTVAQCAQEFGRTVAATESLLRRAQTAFREQWNAHMNGEVG